MASKELCQLSAIATVVISMCSRWMDTGFCSGWQHID